MTVSEVLLKAADFVERGWTQKDYAKNASGEATRYFPGASCFCVLGALHYAAGIKSANDRGSPLYLAACGAVGAVVGTRHLSEWNDAPYRTQAEVVSALRQAARQASTGGEG